MSAIDGLISIIIIIIFLLIIYLKITKKTFQEAVDDIKSIFATKPTGEITIW